jgi:hypothetical protein
MITAEARRARAAALRELDHHWGGAYDLAVTRAGWVARRLDDGRALCAGDPERLRALIITDYSAHPVPRDVRDRPGSAPGPDRD